MTAPSGVPEPADREDVRTRPNAAHERSALRTFVTEIRGQRLGVVRRLDERDTQLAEHEAFKTLAISRLAAQGDEIRRLRATASAVHGSVHTLPTRRSTGQIGPC
jgi:hypothetical protein